MYSMDSNFVDGLPELPALAENAVDTTVDHLRTVTKRARILGTANDQGPAYTEALQRKAQTIVRVAQSTDPQQVWQYPMQLLPGIVVVENVLLRMLSTRFIGFKRFLCSGSCTASAAVRHSTDARDYE